MRTQTIIKNPWTKGEKVLIGVILLTVSLAVVGRLWWHHASDEPVVSIPTPVMPTQNAYNYFQSAAAMELDRGKIMWAIIPWSSRQHDAPRNDPNDRYYSLADKAALVQENTAAFRILRQGLAYPCQNPTVRSYGSGSYRRLVKGYASLEYLARLLTLESQVKQERGDWERAVERQLDAIKIGEGATRGGPLDALLNGDVCQEIGREPVWKQMEHLSPAQSRAAAQRMEKIMSLHVPFADVMQQEEWTGEALLLEEFDRDPQWRGRDAWQRLISGNNYESRAQQAQMLLISKKTVMQNYRTYMDRVIENAHQPYAARPAPPAMLLDYMTQIFVPSDLDFERLSDMENETENALLAVSFALRAYRLEHGAYPPTLNALVPGYLARVPDDPFALSGPLHYKRSGSKYVLYSVGPDGKDDQGTPIFNTNQPPPPPGHEDARHSVWANSRGDIVAGVND